MNAIWINIIIYIPMKLFLVLYLAKFLDILAKLFFPYFISHCCSMLFVGEIYLG